MCVCMCTVHRGNCLYILHSWIMRSYTWIQDRLSSSSPTTEDEERNGMQERVRGWEVGVCAWTHTKSKWWELVPTDDVTFSTPHPPLCSPLPLAAVQHASSHCLLHCNLPSFTVKHQNQLTSFLPLHLFTSAELKCGQARFSARAAER